MRILHLLSQTQLTGSEVYAKTIIEKQTQDGHHVFVISDKIHIPLKVPFLSMPISSSRSLQRRKTISDLRKFLIKEKIDVVHCHSRAAVRHAFYARKKLFVAMVTTLHGRQHVSFSKKVFDIYGDYLIAICENVQEAMIKSFGTSPWKMRLVRNPIESLEVSTSSKKKSEIRLGIFGRSTGPKGERIEKIIMECVENWLQQYQHLFIEVGVTEVERVSSQAQKRIQELVQKYGHRFNFHGPQKDFVSHLKSLDLVIASGRIAVEALMQGVSVFALGEYTFHGLVTTTNLSDVLCSNFGDIGIEAMEGPFEIQSINKSLSDWIQNPPNNEESKWVMEKVNQEFGSSRIYKKIMDIYRAAIFKNRIPKNIPILMYHKIPDEDLRSRHKIFVKKDLFEKHLQYFKSKKFTTMTFQELSEYWNLKKDYLTFPKKPLVLTFDDGYLDNLINAQPLLKKYGFKATIFLLSDHKITENVWDSDTGEEPAKLMTLEQKKQLDQSIFEIGSHGNRHIHLTQIEEKEAFEEMKKSKEKLESDLETKIYAFAYPYGSTNQKIAELCKEAGYDFAVNTDRGGFKFSDGPCALFRVNVFPQDGAMALWKKTSSWYRRYFYWKRKR